MIKKIREIIPHKFKRRHLKRDAIVMHSIWTKLINIGLCLVIVLSLFIFYYNNNDTLSNNSSDTILSYDENSLIHILYPITTNKKLNQYIDQYMQTQITSFKQTTQHKLYLSTPELNIDYDMEIFNQRFLSMKFTIYTYIQKSKTTTTYLNYDLQTNQFFTLDQILDVSKLKQALSSIGNNQEINNNPTIFALTKDSFVLDNQQYSFEFIKPFLKVSLEVSTNNPLPFFYPPSLPIETSDKPMIALTFDDGPSAKYTTRIMKTLSENDARATFFVIGKKIKDYAPLLQEMIQRGNEIGNHTYNHKRLTTLTSAEATNQIKLAQDDAQRYLNYDMKIIRPPYGTNTPVTKLYTSMPQIMWTLDTRDWESRNTKKIIDKVMKNVKENDIVLFHDIYPSTADAIDILVPLLIEEGYQLVTISELLEKNGYQTK